jgi:hypothetical protein
MNTGMGDAASSCEKTTAASVEREGSSRASSVRMVNP